MPSNTNKYSPGCNCCGSCADITINASWTTCVGVTTTTGLFSVTGPESASQTGNGNASVTVHTAGTYSYTIGVTNYHSASGSFTVACGDTHTISVAALIPLTQEIQTKNPSGTADPFVTLVIKDNSGAVYSTGLYGTNDIPGSLPYTINLGGSIQPRYASQTVTVSTVSGACATNVITVNSGTGYAYRCSCSRPISDTLTVSDRYGGTTITWDSGTSKWHGFGTASAGARPSSCQSGLFSPCAAISGSGQSEYQVDCFGGLFAGFKGQIASLKWCLGGTAGSPESYSGIGFVGVCGVLTGVETYTFPGTGCQTGGPFSGGAYEAGDTIVLSE